MDRTAHILKLGHQLSEISTKGCVVELFLAEFGMAHYRICTIGLDGHFLSVEEIECANDQKAIQKAQQAVDDRNVELWQGDRFIVRLSPKTTTTE